jgi:hypothetical protein
MDNYFVAADYPYDKNVLSDKQNSRIAANTVFNMGNLRSISQLRSFSA